jgi:tetratricopeptide (TPR) repeat protein
MNSESKFERAVSLHHQEKYAEAESAYREALLHDSVNSSIWANLGTALRKLGHLDAAALCAQRALQLAPDKHGHVMNWGNCLVDLDRKDEALRALSKAVSMAPDDIIARTNYAIGLRAFCHYEEALAQFDAVCAARPNDMMAKWDRALTLLHLGRYAEGWDAFEVRWKIDASGKWQYPFPRWNGEELRGKTILIHEEQGFGDTILCAPATFRS